MQKGALLIAFVLVLTGFINLVSAYYGSYYASCFSNLQCILDLMDPSWIILGGVFVVSALLINLALSRTPLGDKDFSGKPIGTTVTKIVSVVIAFFIIYSLNKSGFDYEGIWYNIFFFVPYTFWDFAAAILPLAIPVLALILSFRYGWKKGIGSTLMILGGILMAGGFTAQYDGGFLIIVGIIIFLIGLFFMKEAKRP